MQGGVRARVSQLSIRLELELEPDRVSQLSIIRLDVT